MQATVGPIIGSGPTHVAVDNLALRLARLTEDVVKRANQGKEADDSSRFRHCIVICGYKLEYEVAALKHMLAHGPNSTSGAAVNKGWKGGSNWKLNLSLVSWFLALIGAKFPGFPMSIQPDDKPTMLELQAKLAADSRLDTIRAKVSGNLDLWLRF
jgi:hypothetical protein